MENILIVITGSVVFLFILLMALARRYKRCPSDRILVVYGKVGGSTSAKCIHGGAAFIMPIIQDYEFLDLTPQSIEVNLTNALSKQNIRVDVPSRFTVGISTEPGIMNNAAERLLGLSQTDVHDLAKDIIFGQLRLVVATMDIEEINNNRDKFLDNVAKNVEAELKKIGLKLINVNVTDIKDESGYIEALGKEAAAKAVNDARKSVAEKERDGSIGEAQAKKDERIQVADANSIAVIGEAEADRNQRIQLADADAKSRIGEAEAKQRERVATSDANALAVKGENLAKIDIANSDSERREREAEALRKAVTAEKVATAKAKEDSYEAERLAEDARAAREKASRHADIIIPAEIDKSKKEIDAEAEAERIRRHARGEADAIYYKMEAEARGLLEIMSKQAEGFERIVKAAGDNSRDAVLLMIADKLPELVKTQVEAIKNIKIDKVTVWDSGNGGQNGASNTANFMSGMLKTLPPMEEMFKMAGLGLPDMLQGQKPEKEEHTVTPPLKGETVNGKKEDAGGQHPEPAN
ncbi:flotillin family protein [Roseivirga sp. BDSF3-8]|uniref:flotillin family protein n=1 Tax=Roseivirga sp. BDSF3-8 TaxID=3241598 RepID=UPI00353194A7